MPGAVPAGRVIGQVDSRRVNQTAKLHVIPGEGSGLAALDLERLFTYHPPIGNQPERYEHLRRKGHELAALIQDLAPDSAERTIAVRNVREAVMWANAAIACNEVVT